MFRLEFSTDNNAFVEDAHGEICRILGQVAEHLDTQRQPLAEGVIRDINGATFGKWQYTPED